MDAGCATRICYGTDPGRNRTSTTGNIKKGAGFDLWQTVITNCLLVDRVQGFLQNVSRGYTITTGNTVQTFTVKPGVVNTVFR